MVKATNPDGAWIRGQTKGTVRVPATDGADFQSKGRHVGTDPIIRLVLCGKAVICVTGRTRLRRLLQDGARPARGQGVIAAWDTDPEVQWTGF